MKEVTSFFDSITTKNDKAINEQWRSIIYICATEFGWTQQEIEETEIPFLFDLIETRHEVLKKQEDSIKKSKRRL